jgi:hypothetical protein
VLLYYYLTNFLYLIRFGTKWPPRRFFLFSSYSLNFLLKPSTDVTLELEKTQGTDDNLIGKIVVKEIK